MHTSGTVDRGIYPLPICNGKMLFFFSDIYGSYFKLFFLSFFFNLPVLLWISQQKSASWLLFAYGLVASIL